MTKPNYELLKEAYAIIDGIPNEFFNLSSWVRDGKKFRPGETCNTIACAGGWLAQHPKFNELGLRLAWERGNFGRGSNALSLYHEKTRSRDIAALVAIFGIQHTDAINLFSTAGNSRYDANSDVKRNYNNIYDSTQHKPLFLNRVRTFLKNRDVL